MRRTLRRSNKHVTRSLLALSVAASRRGRVRGCRPQEHRHPLADPVQQLASAARPDSAHAEGVATTTVPAPRSSPVPFRSPLGSLPSAFLHGSTQLGLNANGTVEVPTSVKVPGWFSPGPSPGQVGSAVILGHVDSYQGPGVFFQLRTLQPGDQINVNLADGVVATFNVTSVVMYQKTQFPDQQVYGSNGSSELQLVTCGGTFDPQTGHYLSNIVVYSSFVSAT